MGDRPGKERQDGHIVILLSDLTDVAQADEEH